MAESKNNPNARPKGKIVIIGTCGDPVIRTLVDKKFEWRCATHGSVPKLKVVHKGGE